jgi:hypothetical protein
LLSASARFTVSKKSFLLAFLALLCFAFPSLSTERTGGYGGLEFLGSSLISRLELERLLHLRPGATIETTEKSLEKLKLALERKAVKANLEVVPAADSFYVAVDVIETGLAALPNRHLDDPRHIALPNEKPFTILEELKTRLQKLQDEGRPAGESYDNGFKIYSDFAATRTAERLGQELEGQKAFLFRILASDPNNERRADTVEMLNWTPDPVQNCRVLIAALDDSDMRVRRAAAKYIWARVSLLPDDFPFADLIEGLSKQLSRPSYHDRLRAMAALAAIARRDSDSITAIKSFDEKRLQEIASASIVPDSQELARKLLSVCASPPPLKRVPVKAPANLGTEF